MAIEPKHEVLDVDLRAVANTVRIGWWGIMKEGRKEGGSIIMTASVAGYVLNSLSFFTVAVAHF